MGGKRNRKLTRSDRHPAKIATNRYGDGHGDHVPNDLNITSNHPLFAFVDHLTVAVPIISTALDLIRVLSDGRSTIPIGVRRVIARVRGQTAGTVVWHWQQAGCFD
jgi:hypothetical protein